MWTGPESVAQQANRRLHRIFLTLLFIVAVLNGFRPMLDQVDLGWHVAQGRWMVHHLSVYRTDDLNYPTAGQRVVDEYPLFQVVLYAGTLCGWWGPCALTAIGYVVLLSILVLTGRALGLGPSSVFALTLAAMLVYLNVAFPLRPHLVTFLGIAAFGSFLLRHREAAVWTRFWPLALVEVFWTNCHGGFVVGPMMVGLFGVEMIARRWWRNRQFPWTAVRIWSAATALVFLACFLNPYGVARFGAPFYQEHLEVIRAYVGEMQPLSGGANSSFQRLTLFAAALIFLAVVLRRGAVSWSFLLLAGAFYFEALEMKKAWPVFGLFLPLLVLSSDAFARTTITRRRGLAVAGIIGHIVATVPLVIALMARLGGTTDSSLAVLWREWEAGRTELPVAAASWLRQNHLAGPLLHRCEDGGWLQMEEVGPTFADTGFGKYDEAFIRLTGLMAFRPHLLPTLLAQWKPRFVVCDNFAFNWPLVLRQAGCRLVFYAPNSSVWTAPGFTGPWPTVTNAEIESAFLDDLRRHGRPRDMGFQARNVVALNSLGDPYFAFAQLEALPPDIHRTGWYWDAARLLCFEEPPLPADLRHELRREANGLGGLTREFRAFDDLQDGDPSSARALLHEIPTSSLSDREAVLLIRVDRVLGNQDEALAVARTDHLFDLFDAERWVELAELEQVNRNPAAALEAWKKAEYYGPDIVPAYAYALLKMHAALPP